MIKIATWNLCLGLSNKKDYVYKTLNSDNIDICLFQEVEIDKNIYIKNLTSKNYCLEVETITEKARCAVALKNDVAFVRRNDLEDIDLSMIVIDINNTVKYRIINIYRQFNPPNNNTQLEHFLLQLNTFNAASWSFISIKNIN